MQQHECLAPRSGAKTAIAVHAVTRHLICTPHDTRQLGTKLLAVCNRGTGQSRMGGRQNKCQSSHRQPAPNATPLHNPLKTRQRSNQAPGSVSCNFAEHADPHTGPCTLLLAATQHPHTQHLYMPVHMSCLPPSWPPTTGCPATHPQQAALVRRCRC